MNRLKEILRSKHIEIEALRPRQAELDRHVDARNDYRGFRAALQRSDGRLAIIAEIKKASPSAGVIATEFNPVQIANNYERAGADAISILTDEKFFQGALPDLTNVRRTVSLPLLRKDFILDGIQIVESAAFGADAILLIVGALEQEQLVDFLHAARRYRLDALAEVHNAEELVRALDAGAEIIGINNRDLATFDVDLAVTEKLSAQVPDGVLLVSESGIKSTDDVARVKACDVDAILVGEALMRGQISIETIRAT